MESRKENGKERWGCMGLMEKKRLGEEERRELRKNVVEKEKSLSVTEPRGSWGEEWRRKITTLFVTLLHSTRIPLFRASRSSHPSLLSKSTRGGGRGGRERCRSLSSLSLLLIQLIEIDFISFHLYCQRLFALFLFPLPRFTF